MSLIGRYLCSLASSYVRTCAKVSRVRSQCFFDDGRMVGVISHALFLAAHVGPGEDCATQYGQRGSESQQQQQ